MVEHPVLLIAIPLLASFLIAALRKGKIIAFIALAINTILALLLFWRVYENGSIYEIIAFSPPIGINLFVDNLSALLATVINLLAIINFFSFDKEDAKFYVLYLLAIASSTGIVITGDIFNMFVFFEISAVASYALIASKGSEEAMEASLKYIILGSLASVLFLVGIALLYSQMRSLNIYDIAERIGEGNFLKLLSFAFILTAMGVEAELFPLNGWVPDAYQGAKSGIAAMLAFAPSKAAIYAIARLLTIFSYEQAYNLALYIGIATFVIGEIAAFTQRNHKRLLAFSSIGQMGLILISFSLIKQSDYAILASFFLLVNHATCKSSLFLLDGFGNKLAKYAGVASSLAIIGMPPFAGFWGKIYLLFALASAEQWIILILIAVGIAFESAYFARYLNEMLARKETKNAIPASLMATISLILGILPIIYEFASIGGVLNA